MLARPIPRIRRRVAAATPCILVLAAAGSALAAPFPQPPSEAPSRSTATAAVETPALPTERPFDLDACVRIALGGTPLLSAAREGVIAAREAVAEARAPYLPEAGLAAGYRRFDSHLFLPSEVPLQDSALGATDDWSAGLAVGYTLFDSGLRRAEHEAASAAHSVSEHELARVRQDVTLAVHRAYYRLLSAHAATSVAETRLDRGRDHLALSRTRFEAGAAPRADVLRVETEVAEAELALVEARGAVRVARGELNTAMGLPVDLPIRVAEPDDPSAAPADAGAAYDVESALAQRPELEAARQRIEAAEHLAKAIRGAYGPRLRAEATYGWRDSALLPEDQDWSAGLYLRMPLFTGFARTHRLARARSDVRARAAEAEALSDRVALEVWTAASDLAEARQALERIEVARRVARQSLDFARARYDAGAGTISDLLDAESALAQVESAGVAAAASYRLAGSLLLRARGEL